MGRAECISSAMLVIMVCCYLVHMATFLTLSAVYLDNVKAVNELLVKELERS